MNQYQSKLAKFSKTKLDENQVVKIRDLLIERKLTYRQIAEIFNVSYWTVRNINNGKTWNHVEGIGSKIRKTTRGAKLDETQVAKIRDLLIEGKLTHQQIAKMFGVSFANIRVINDGKTWNHVEGMGSKLRPMKKKGCRVVGLRDR